MRIITLPYTVEKETFILKTLLALPDVSLHIRKPDSTRLELQHYLSEFTDAERTRMFLHQHVALAEEFGIVHRHYTAAMRQQTNLLANEIKQNGIVSTSTHSWLEFNTLPSLYHSAVVSPVFPSISKPGYGNQQRIALNGRQNKHTKAIALGGISSRSIQQLDGSDFQDFALCGALWEAQNPVGEAKKCQEIFQSFTYQQNDHVL